MALFKLRKGGEEKTRAAAGPGESIEAMRRRARHRLVGAVVLVLAGVIGFPLVFDTQPRPVDVDIAIEIPDRDKVRPLAPATPAAAQVAAASATAPAAESAAAPARATVSEPRPAAEARPAAAAASASAEKPADKPVDKAPPPKPEAPARAEAPAKAEAPASRPKAEARAEPKPEPKKAEAILTETRQEAGLAARKPDDGEAARARALLEGRPSEVAAAAQEGRFVVQVGAFAEEAKAREARVKLERAGIKTYTHVADTPAGRRIRVRAGPFPTRAQADRAADKIKGLDLPAAILTL